MATYTIRVELHRANAADYERLHDLMALMGYKRTIVGDEGREDHLPTAMYDLPYSPLACTQVCDQVAAIANTVEPGSWVFVDEVTRRAWRTAPTKPATVNALAVLTAWDRRYRCR
jgi:hypothetical protein